MTAPTPDAPLYLIQGVYLPDESYLTGHDLYARAPTAAMVAEVADAAPAVHGRLRRARRDDRAHGTWTADVSAWTAGWLVGVEWDPVSTAASDLANAAAPAHRGRTSPATPTPPHGTLDHRTAGRTGRRRGGPRRQRPDRGRQLAHHGPVRHPQEPLPHADLVSVDANHIQARPAWPAGPFASYHAYPYYPDLQLLQPSYAGDDPYRAYLLDLKSHHAGLPLTVAEFGVPSSLGSAHRGSRDRDQGSAGRARAPGARRLRRRAGAGCSR